MLVYLFIILLTTFFTFLAEKTIDRSKIAFVFVSILVLVIPSFMAGVRNLSVGTDVSVYETQMFHLATQSESLIEYCEAAHNEFFFLVINYFASYFSDSIVAGLFMIEFFVIFFAYLAMVRMRHYAPMWMMMALYMFGFYNLSFNLMRQVIAVSYLLFCFTYLLKDNSIKKYILLLILSFFFHKTAVIGGMAFLYIFIALNSRRMFKIPLTVMYILGCVGVFFLFQYLLTLLASLGGRFEHFVAYGGGDEAGSKWVPAVFTILLMGDFILIIVSALYYYLGCDDKRTAYIVFMVAVVDTMSQKLGGYTAYASRLSCYFCGVYVLLLPRMMQDKLIHKQTRFILKILLVIAFLIIWWRMIGSTGHTVPYKSDILGITK